DGETGLLVDGVDAMADATRGLLADEAARARLGGAARRKAARLSWPATAAAMGEVLRAAGEGRRLGGVVTGPGHGPSAARAPEPASAPEARREPRPRPRRT